MARHWQILGNIILEMLLEHVLVQSKDHPVSRFGSAMMRVKSTPGTSLKNRMVKLSYLPSF